MEIVGYEVVEARIPESLDSGNVKISTEILFAYRTIQILHIIISVWFILNEFRSDDSSGCMKYHLFNLLYGIIKLTISFL